MTRLLIALSIAGLLAQGGQTPGVLQSYARARALLDAAIEAHGGIDALRAVETMRVEMRGTDVARYQSERADRPFSTFETAYTLHIDLPRGRLVTETRQVFVGGIGRHFRWVTDDAGRDYYVDLQRELHNVREFPAASTQTGNLWVLPQFLLLHAHNAQPSLRYVGRMRLSSGADVEVITASAAGNTMTLAFDVATKRLRANLNVRGDVAMGDVGVEAEFPEYRLTNGALMPARRVVRMGGEVAQDYAIAAATPGYRVPDEMVRPPAGSTDVPAAPAADPVRELAPGVWAITDAGATSLAVAFADHVMVVEAPFDPRGVMRHIERLAPGKPIRYVVPTHHHDDHAAGVRHYAARGAAIVTTEGNRAYFTDIARATLSLGPGAGVAPVASPRFEMIDRARVFTDGARVVEIHNAGPNPHATDMLVAWLPREGILFQGDLIDVPGNGSVTPGSNNPTTASFGAWLAKQNWNVRMFAGTHATLREAASLAQILQQPVR